MCHSGRPNAKSLPQAGSEYEPRGRQEAGDGRRGAVEHGLRAQAGRRDLGQNGVAAMDIAAGDDGDEAAGFLVELAGDGGRDVAHRALDQDDVVRGAGRPAGGERAGDQADARGQFGEGGAGDGLERSGLLQGGDPGATGGEHRGAVAGAGADHQGALAGGARR